MERGALVFQKVKAGEGNLSIVWRKLATNAVYLLLK